MIPPKSDPRWGHFLKNLSNLSVRELSTRMMLNRVKTKLLFNPTDSTRTQVIGEAYDFFVKNQDAVKEDIRVIFG